MKKAIIHIILSSLINYKLNLSGLSNYEIDFINRLFDYAFDYLYDIFKNHIHPKILRFFKRLVVMIKEYIIDVKSRLWWINPYITADN